MDLLKESSIKDVINTSITQSLSRTIITSLTTLLAVTAIYIFGTGVVKEFAFSLIIGVLIGTYSSIFIASPVFLILSEISSKRKLAKDAIKFGTRQEAPKEDSETVKAAKDTKSPFARQKKIVDAGARKKGKKRKK
jgi:preprotein translocase subunit SecF